MNDYVHFGCGYCAPTGWINFDASPTLLAERVPLFGKLVRKNATRFPANVRFGNIVTGLPLEKSSCRGIFCSHVLEHLALNEFGKALNTVYDLLMPGGIFRVLIPDLEWIARAYVEDSSPDAALTFMRKTMLGSELRDRSLKETFIAWLGNSRHLWMWDYKSLAARLADCGFKDIRKAFPGDSSDPMFLHVEDSSRWKDSFGVECSR